MSPKKIINRELSWLSFNYRVLQETDNKDVPLYERIKFLAIFSSNLDEFFRVRVASLRSLLNLKQKSQNELKFNPAELLKEIQRTVITHQNEFGRIFRENIIPELEQNNIFLITDNKLHQTDKEFLKEYFNEKIKPLIQPLIIVKNRIMPFLKNRHIYFAVRLVTKNSRSKNETAKRIRHQYALVEIPTDFLPRFIALPEDEKKHRYVFLDDVVKYCLADIFPAYEIKDVYSVKLTRDAELYIDDEFTGNLLLKIKKGLSKRSTGAPSRFLYDEKMPLDMLKFMRESLKLTKQDMIAGGRYHNYNDFFPFPNPGKKELEFETMEILTKSYSEKIKSIFEEIDNKDQFFYFPYYSYDHVVMFFKQAAVDPSVKEIKITQYRVAENSEIVKALITAAQNGKDVTAFVEVKARFDEESNIKWAEEMEQAGVKVFYSFPGLKVHAKLALVKREIKGKTFTYCYLSTGNFNEKTARIYTDIGLFTSEKNITDEVERVFSFLTGARNEFIFKHLLVAQFNMKKIFIKHINKEIKNAREGKEARIILKMNSLEDRKMINKLYEANCAGVKINIIVRGICCLNPGVKGLSENIIVTSIIDRYLEHSRVFIFHNNGEEIIYTGSADWMKRNLNRRIEVVFPIYDSGIKRIVKDIIEIQLKDNVKARRIITDGKIKYSIEKSDKAIRSQIEVHKYLKEKGI